MSGAELRIPTAEPELPSEMEDGDLAGVITSEVKLDTMSASAWAEEAREAYDMVAGRQWEDADKEILAKQGRQAIVFNRLEPMVDAVCGAQVNNRQEMKFLPRAGDDDAGAEMWNGAISWVRDQCDAEDEESEAFRDTVIGGMGWVETRVADDDPEHQIVMERCDPFEMGWDRAATKRNLADAQHVWRKRRLPRAVVEARWPEFAGVASVAAGGTPEGPVRTAVRPTRDAYADGDEAPRFDDDSIEVTHYQWCETRPEYRVLNPAEDTIEVLDARQWEALGEKVGTETRDRIRHVKRSVKVWWEAFECGGEIAGRQMCPDPKGPTFRCITGRWDRNKRVFYGIVRAVLDPQKWANKWLSQSLHIINTNAKSGVIAEESAIRDRGKFEESYAKTGSVTLVADGGLARLRDKVPPPFPQGFDRLLQFAITSIPDVTGINREMLGTVDREQAGILEAQRKQASQAVLAPLFDSLRRYYKEQGRLLMVFVTKYIPPQQIMRIMGPDGKPQAIQAAMLPDAAQYDIIVDQAPTSPNQKAEVWQTLQPALPAMMKMGMPLPVWAELLRYSPLPESAVTKIVDGLKNQPPPPPDPALLKVKADVEANQAKAATDIQMKQADMVQQREMAQMQMQIELQKAQLDLETQRAKAAQELEIARLKAEQEAQIRQDKMDADIALEERKARIAADETVNRMQREQGVLSKPVADLLQPLADAIERANKAAADIHDQHGRHAAHMSDMMASLARMVTAPKRAVRGSDGRIERVEVVLN